MVWWLWWNSVAQKSLKEKSKILSHFQTAQNSCLFSNIMLKGNNPSTQNVVQVAGLGRKQEYAVIDGRKINNISLSCEVLMALKAKCQGHSPGTSGFFCTISNVWISTFPFKLWKFTDIEIPEIGTGERCDELGLPQIKILFPKIVTIIFKAKKISFFN